MPELPPTCTGEVELTPAQENRLQAKFMVARFAAAAKEAARDVNQASAALARANDLFEQAVGRAERPRPPRARMSKMKAYFYLARWEVKIDKALDALRIAHQD